MNTLLHPVGSQPSAIYWRRRAVVGGGLLVLLLFAWFILKPSGGDPSPEAALAAADAQAPAEQAAPEGETVAGPKACADSDIEVTLSADSESYSADAQPQLQMQISNVGNEPCIRDIGSANNEIIITSGDARVHSSDDCSTTDTPDEATLQPGQTAGLTVAWNRQITDANTGCVSSGNPAAAGSYEAVGSNGDVKSEPVTFILQ